MDSYGRYKNARNASWQCLIDYHVNALPVKISAVARQAGCRLAPYSKSQHLISRLGLESLTQNSGFCARLYDGNILIFYDDRNPPYRIRFTIGHELGHILLGHPMIKGTGCTFTHRNREQDPQDDPFEVEANVFARDVLAPACVLWGLQLHTAVEIAQVCDISLTCGAYRAQRMGVLYTREREFLKTRGRSCFLMHPLEQRVFEQFQDYINRHK